MKPILTILLVTISFSPGFVWAQFGRAIDLVETKEGEMFFHDLDFDGDMDALLVGDNRVAYYENLGGGQLSPQKPLITYFIHADGSSFDNSVSPFLDYDGDGDLDFISKKSSLLSPKVYLHENIGVWNFEEAVEIDNHAIEDQRLIDVDLDGDYDLFGINPSDELVLCMNTSGNFGSPQLITADNISSLRFVDFDTDGYQDIMYYNTTTDSVYICYNTTGTFAPADALIYSTGANFYPIDVDQDGLTDLFNKPSGGFLKYRKNLGGGAFSSVDTQVGTGELKIVDLDLDGDKDIVCKNNFLDYVYYSENAGGSFLSPVGLVTGTDYQIYNGPYFSDINNDILPDMLYMWSSDIYSAEGENDKQWIMEENSGGLDFGLPYYFDTVFFEEPTIISMDDIDGDGKLDMVLASTVHANVQVKKQLPDGTFANEQFVFEELWLNGMDVADLDNDTLPDILTSYSTGNPLIFMVQDAGDFSFTDSIPNPFGSGIDNFKVADLNMDNINDLVMVIDDNVGFCLGTGSGNFGTFVSLDVSTGMYALWVGDVDNDGLPDIFYGVDSFGSLEYLAWCKNQGGAVFSSPVEITNPFPMQELELLDVNGDAALDIVYVTGNSETGGYIFYHLNNGTGSFANSPTSINYWTQPAEILPYDFNGDGFDDFVYISQNTGITIAMNDADLSFSDHVIPNSHFSFEYNDIELADLDNDSDPDILAVQGQMNRVILVKNYFGSNFHLSGSIFFDEDQSESLDSAEQVLPIVDLAFSPVNTTNYTINTGDYLVNLDSGFHSVSYIPSPYWSLTTDSVSYNRKLDAVTPDYDSLLFGFYPDTLIALMNGDLAGGVAICNDTTNFWIYIQNSGTIPVNAIAVLIPDPDITFISSDVTPDSLNIQLVSWNIDSMDILSTEILPLQMQIPPGTFMNDTLVSILQVYHLDDSGDSLLMFTDTLNQVVVCSYDPNIKSVAPAGDSIQGFISQDIAMLEYQIDFQNTGTDTAYNVIITDQLSDHLDWSTFNFISSSHAVSVLLNGTGELTFEFNNIDLPDTNTNEPASHGFVKYQIKLDTNLLVGTQILNDAKIFFDLNPPIYTNTTINTISGCKIQLDIDTTSWYCQGQLLELTSNNSSLYTATWQINNIPVHTGPAFDWNLTATGTHQLELHLEGLYCTDSAQYEISVNDDMETTEQNYYLCQGDSVEVLGNFIYAPTLISDTTYNINGCGSIVNYVINSSIPDTAIYESGASLFATATSGSFQWYDCGTGTIIPGQTNNYYDPLQGGEYAVIVNNSGCIDTSSCVLIDFSEIQAPDQTELLIFPNPTTGTFFIAGLPSHSSVEIRNISGQVILTKFGNDQIEINLINQPPGFYTVRLLSDPNCSTSILIKQ